MDVYLNAVFCPLAMVDKSVFEQEGWHRSADGTVSGVVYNEMQGALAAPDAQLEMHWNGPCSRIRPTALFPAATRPASRR